MRAWMSIVAAMVLAGCLGSTESDAESSIIEGENRRFVVVVRDSVLDAPTNRWVVSVPVESSLEWSVSAPPMHGKAKIGPFAVSEDEGNTCVVRYAPAAKFQGGDEFTLRATDGVQETTFTFVVSVVVPWRVLNGRQPLGADTRAPTGAYFAKSYRAVNANSLSDGSMVFSAPSTAGRYIGRLTSSLRWEYLTSRGWSSRADAIPTSIEGAHEMIGPTELFESTDRPGELFGVATTGLRHGAANELDTHGAPVGVRFDGRTWKQWLGGNTYDAPTYRELISSWDGFMQGESAHFAYDAERGDGLLVGSVGWSFGEVYPQPTAVRYDSVAGWQRWNRAPGEEGQWLAGDPAWPIGPGLRTASGRSTFILDSDVDLTKRYPVNILDVAHVVGTRSFLVLLGRSAALYEHEPAPRWSWWDGDAFQGATAQSSSFLDDLGRVFPQSDGVTAERAIALRDGSVLVLGGGSGIFETLYDPRERRFRSSRRVALFGGWVGDPIMTPDGKIAVLVVSNNVLRLLVRSADGTWNTDSVVLVAENGSLGGPALGLAGGRLVVLVQGRDELLAYGDPADPAWTAEQTLRLEAPGARAVDALPRLSLKTSSSATAFARTEYPYAGDAPGALAVDPDGYLYSATTGYCSLVVSPPDAQTDRDHHSWGGFWDLFRFPTGMAVDAERHTLFVVDNAIPSGGPIVPKGRLRAYDFVAHRDWSLGSDWQRSGNGQEIARDLKWPGGVAVDSAAGLLYAASAFDHQVHVYDRDSRARLFSFGKKGSGFDEFSFPTGITVDSSGTVHVADTLNHRIVRYRADRVRATPLSSYGTEGYAEAQLLYPTALSAGPTGVFIVDTINRRITLFSDAGDYLDTFSSYESETGAPLQFERPGGIDASRPGYLYVGDVAEKEPDCSICSRVRGEFAPRVLTLRIAR